MDIRAIKIFMNMQLEEMEQANTPEESDMVMLGMADYLLEHVKEQPDIFLNTDSNEVRRAFLRCGSMGEKLRIFYEKYRTPVEHAAARVLERIESNTSEIMRQHQKMLQYEQNVKKMTESSKQLEEENRNLLAREEELEQAGQTFAELNRKIENYRHIAEEVTPEVLRQLSEEMEECRKFAEKRESERNNLEKETDAAKVRVNQAEAAVKELQTEKQKIDHQEEEFRKRRDQLKEEIQKSNAQNEKVMSEIGELSEKIVEAENEQKELKAFLEENERLEKGILEEGYFDREDFIAKLKDVKQKSHEIQETYEKILINIRKDAEELYKKIKKLQVKNSDS